MKKYRALVGLNYKPSPSQPEKRVEAGDEADDIPTKSLPWLLDQQLVEEVK